MAMIRFAFRAIGVIVLAAAFVALLYDGTQSIADGRVRTTPAVEIWSHVDSESLRSVRERIERDAAPWIWERIATPALAAPAFVVFGILGALLMLIGRRPRPKIGYARR